MSNTAQFKFTGTDGRSYTFEGEPKQVANIRRSVEAASAKIEAAMAQSVKRTRSTEPKTPTRVQQARAWAREQGIEVGARGRLAPDVLAQFEAAQEV